MEKLVIIGGGMAAGRLCEELLAKTAASGRRFDITLIGEEPHGVYNRIKLVKTLAEDHPEAFWLNPEAWFQDHGIAFLKGNRALRIDRTQKVVELADGKTLAYDRLVLATGAAPFIPPTPGSDLPGVIALRSLQDAQQARQWLEGRQQVLVIGGGLLGLELALGLKELGKSITVSHLTGTLMEFQLAPKAGEYLQKRLEQKGFKFLMGNPVAEIRGDANGVTGVVLKDGTTVATQAVFFNTGIRPRIDLAQASGLECRRGILVDDGLQTSDPAIFAIGECCEHAGKVFGLVAPVYEHARILVSRLWNETAAYKGSPPAPTRLKSDIAVIAMGRFNEEPGDEVAVWEDPKALVYKKLVLRDGKLVGVNLVGDELNADTITVHFSAGLPLPGKLSDLLFPGAGAGEALPDAKAWPDDTTICDCAGVSAGKLRGAIKDGCDTLGKLMNRTRAGTGCGNCKNKLKALLVAEVGELKDDPSERWFVPGIPLERPALEAFILERNLKSVSAVFAALRDWGALVFDDAKSRAGLDFLLNFLHRGHYQVENDSRHPNDRFSGNIQKDGRFSVIPRMHGGMTTPDELLRIAQVAKEYNLQVKVTGADRLGLYSVKKEDLPAIWAKLDMDCGHAYTKTFRSCKSCVGSQYCRFGLGDSLDLAAKLDDRYRGTMGPAKFKMAVSGCPRNCAEATIKDFGVVACEGGWDLWIGGNGGSHVIPAKHLCRVKTEAEVFVLADRFYEFYRRHGRWLERTAYFVERLGLEKVKEALLHDTPENLAGLQADFQRTVDNYVDPWKQQDHFPVEPPLWQVRSAEPDEGEQVWREIGPSEAFAPGEARIVDVEGTPVAVFRNRLGGWAASQSLCPHEGGPMVHCVFGAGKLTCQIHSYSYDIHSGQCSEPSIPALKVYPVEEAHGQIRIRVR